VAQDSDRQVLEYSSVLEVATEDLLAVWVKPL
jgi:hypothetical protein